MPKQKLVNETFQAVSRGLLGHLRSLDDAQTKLYLYCLLRAKNMGAGKGSFIAWAKDMLEDLGWWRQKMYKTLNSMPEYIQVKYPHSRHAPLEIKVLKFKSFRDFYQSQSATGKQFTGNGTGNDSQPVKKLPVTNHDRYPDSNGTVTTDKPNGRNDLDPGIKVKKVKKRDLIKERGEKLKQAKTELRKSMLPYVNLYPQDMRQAFFDYWTEPNHSKTKCRYQMEKTWSIGGRLSTWARRDNNFNKGGGSGKSYAQQDEERRLAGLRKCMRDGKAAEMGFGISGNDQTQCPVPAGQGPGAGDNSGKD